MEANLSCGSASDMVMVLSSIPRKVSSGTGPSTLSPDRGTPNSQHVASVVRKATAHSSELE